MSKKLFVVRIVGAFALLTLLLGGISLAIAQGPADAQQVDVAWHPQSGSGAVPGAWAQLVRNDSGASFTFHGTELKPGHVYTVWFVVVNNPAACASSPCAPMDIILNSEALVQLSRNP